MPLAQSDVRNRLLALMSPDDFGAISPHLEPVDLPRRYEMAKRDEPIEHCYFIESGIGSVVAATPEGLRVEVGIVGRDGLSPVALILGCTTAPYEFFMQVPGYGYRITRENLATVLAETPSIMQMLLRYAHVASVQTSYTALCNAVHPIDERLARWLLMCHDRADNNTISLTHEFLSIMLAVRRPSVTTSLHVLEGNGFIRSSRGLITIRNRDALKAFTADAYGGPEREYESNIGPIR